MSQLPEAHSVWRHRRNKRAARVVRAWRWGTRGQHESVEYRYIESAPSRSERGIILYRINTVHMGAERFLSNFEEV